MKAAAERTIGGGPAQKPRGSAAGASSGGGLRPAIRGPKIPEALRARLRAQLDSRIDKDLRDIRGLRTEAISFLQTFISETPKDAREMPEALMRLGELRWELERDNFVERFKAWEAK